MFKTIKKVKLKMSYFLLSSRKQKYTKWNFSVALLFANQFKYGKVFKHGK